MKRSAVFVSRLTRGTVGYSVAVSVTFAAAVHAAPIYGGPTFDQATNVGWRSELNNVVAGDGVAAAYGSGHAAGDVAGTHALRWSTAGNGGMLGTLRGGRAIFTVTVPNDIDAGGTVVGRAQLHDSQGRVTGTAAVRWDVDQIAATILNGLSTPATTAGTYSVWDAANAINAGGTVVGQSSYRTGSVDLGTRAVRWDAGSTTPTVLHGVNGPLATLSYGSAEAINAAGTIVGSDAVTDSAGNDLGTRAVRWDAGSTRATALGVLARPAGEVWHTFATDISDGGAIVGTTLRQGADPFTQTGRQAVLWRAGETQAIRLETFEPTPADTELVASRATDVDSSGRSVGYVERFDAAGNGLGSQAVRWDDRGEIFALDSLLNGPGVKSQALATNDAGWTVGTIYRGTPGTASESDRAAVLWDADGRAIDLATFLDADSGWTRLLWADDISETNWVAGRGLFDPDGAGGQAAYTRLFLIQVPEPATFAAAAFGSVFLTGRRRLRRSSAT